MQEFDSRIFPICSIDSWFGDSVVGCSKNSFCSNSKISFGGFSFQTNENSSKGFHQILQIKEVFNRIQSLKNVKIRKLFTSQTLLKMRKFPMLQKFILCIIGV
jgi:hypothetical protein